MDGEKKCCRNCKYGHMDELKDIICVNGDSEYVSYWVGYDFAVKIVKGGSELKYSAEEIKEAAAVIRNELLNDDALYDAFIDNIVSGLRQAPAEPGLRIVAERIAHALIGCEE